MYLESNAWKWALFSLNMDVSTVSQGRSILSIVVMETSIYNLLQCNLQSTWPSGILEMKALQLVLRPQKQLQIILQDQDSNVDGKA
jgi:hypothetical protein